jgi:prepilin-type N-terminal cleavage/methylation domain-containing protein
MPSRVLTRRDPPNGKKEFSTKNGFTVIEMMIAVGVLAIITALALPSYRAIIEKRKVTSAAEQAMAFLSSAQLEAVKRNEIVAVHFGTYEEDGDSYWCLGMTNQADCDCRPAVGTCSIGGAVRSFQSDILNYRTGASSIDATATQFAGEDNILRFDPVRGLTLNSETAQLALISPDQAMYALNVELSPTGRVKICTSARGSLAVPGFEPCREVAEPETEG